MEFLVLGLLQVFDAGRPVTIGAPRQRALLAVMLANSNRVVSTDRLLDLVWGDDPPEVGALRYHISKLRDALEPDRESGDGSVIITEAPGYVLRVSPGQLDSLGFESLVREAELSLATDPAGALGFLDEALSMWRGGAYADFAYDEFARSEILRLEERRLEAIEARFDALLALGRDREVIGELQALASEHPHRERLTAALMLALYRSGRQADALAAYQSLRRELGEGLGIEPSKELVDLEERILLQDESLAVEAAPPAAEFLRGYVLRGRIGEGAHGVVWRAAQPGVGREVAIKAIRPDIANRPGFVRRFEMEAQLVASLEHPHIISLFDFWRDPEGAYLVMPHLRGGNLAHLLEQGPLQPAAALELVEAVGGALSYAHRRGVVHRDVTPQNVLLDDEGHPYVADFGVAALIGETGPPTSSSPAYLAPELRDGVAVPESDVYSLGVLAHAVLTGDIPMVDQPLQRPSHINPDLPEAVDEVIARATAIDVAERFLEPADFVAALAGVLDGGRVARGSAQELRNPYKGLRAFTEADSPDFFGRDVAVSELVDAIARNRLVAVVGPSGCGKSSLVRAGLLSDLRQGALPGSERWLITDMYPGARPLQELAEALMRVAVDRPTDLVGRLAEGVVGDVLGGLLPRDAEMLLVVDQFEELFTLTPDEGERRRFLDVLTSLTTDPASRARVVLTLRADFFDRPLGYAGFGDLLRRGMVPIAVPSVESLEQAVVGPAESVGLSVEPGLERVITQDVADQPGGLPLLEFALTELFHERVGNDLTAAGYQRTGGVLGALGRRAEDLYVGSDDAGREAIEHVFLRLVTVEEGAEDTRRRIPLTELHEIGIDPDTLQRVLDQYGTHRLITFDRDPETRAPTVEVAHEALLSRWDRLRSWIDERRDDLVIHRRLAASVREWHDSERRAAYLLSGGRLEHYERFAEETDLALTGPERGFLLASRQAEDDMLAARRRRRLGVLATLASAAVVAAVLAIVAFVAQRNAEVQRTMAQEQAGVAEQEAARAEREASVARARDLASNALLAAEADPLLAMNLAVLAFEGLPQGEEPGPALETALRTAKSADRSAGLYKIEDGLWTLADISPDGSTVAVVNGQQLIVLDSATMEDEVWSYREPGPDALSSVAFSSDGEFIIVSVVDERSFPFFGSEVSVADGVPDPRLLVFKSDSGELVHTHPVELEGACQAYPSWRSDLALLGIGVEGCKQEGIGAQFVDTTTWEVVYEDPGEFVGVVFGREGTLATMSGGYNTGTTAKLVDTAHWSIVRELDYEAGTLSPDGTVIAGHSWGQFDVVLEDATTGNLIDRFPTGNAFVVELQFSPAGDALAIGTTADSTLLFDVVTGELIDTIQRATVVSIAVGENYLYVAGDGVVSKWDTTGIGLGDVNTVPLGLWVNANSIWWTPDGTLVADVADAATSEWFLYPIDSSTGDLGEPIPYGLDWVTPNQGIAPITGNRVVMFRYRETGPGVFEYGPLELVDLSTGEFTAIAGCWMEEQAALAHEPCPGGEPHPAGHLAYTESSNGTEFMIFGTSQSEAGMLETYVSIWDSSTLTEVSRRWLGGAEEFGFFLGQSVLTEEHLVVISSETFIIRVLDRVTRDVLFEDAASGSPLTEHDRAQNRVWMANNFRTEVWLLDLDTFEFRTVTGYVADSIRGLATSPSGELVAVGSADGFVRIYTDEGELRHSIPLPNPSDAWWLDEENLVVGTGNGPWTVITLDPDRLLAAVKASLQQGFTDAECSLYEINPCPTLEELKGD